MILFFMYYTRTAGIFLFLYSATSVVCSELINGCIFLIDFVIHCYGVCLVNNCVSTQCNNIKTKTSLFHDLIFVEKIKIISTKTSFCFVVTPLYQQNAGVIVIYQSAIILYFSINTYSNLSIDI